MIDSIREQIQQRLDQLASEADRLRKALAVLDPRSPSSPAVKAPTRKPKAAKAATRKPKTANAPATVAAANGTTTRRPRAETPKAKPKASATNRAPTRRARKPAATKPRRTAPGSTRTTVLAALSSGPLTAGEVAEKTGLARPTVSTTLSRLAKTGDVQKAERGYQLPDGPSAAATSPSDTTEA